MQKPEIALTAEEKALLQELADKGEQKRREYLNGKYLQKGDK